MQVAFYLAGEITQVLDVIPWVRCSSDNVCCNEGGWKCMKVNECGWNWMEIYAVCVECWYDYKSSPPSSKVGTYCCGSIARGLNKSSDPILQRIWTKMQVMRTKMTLLISSNSVDTLGKANCNTISLSFQTLKLGGQTVNYLGVFIMPFFLRKTLTTIWPTPLSKASTRFFPAEGTTPSF